MRALSEVQRRQLEPRWSLLQLRRPPTPLGVFPLWLSFIQVEKTEYPAACVLCNHTVTRVWTRGAQGTQAGAFSPSLTRVLKHQHATEEVIGSWAPKPVSGPNCSQPPVCSQPSFFLEAKWQLGV